MIDLDVKAKGFDKTLQNLANYDQVATQENRKAMGKAVAIVTKAGKENVAVGVSGEARSKFMGRFEKLDLARCWASLAVTRIILWSLKKALIPTGRMFQAWRCG